MATVKTAISVEPALFQETTQVAKELGQTRSGVVSQALREFLDKYRNRRFYEQMCAAHSGPQDDEDDAFVEFSKRQLRKVADQG